MERREGASGEVGVREQVNALGSPQGESHSPHKRRKTKRESTCTYIGLQSIVLHSIGY